MYRDNFEQDMNSLILRLNLTLLYQDFRREIVDDEEEASKYDEDSSTVDEATGGDEDPTENVENVQLGEKEKVTIYCALEEHEFDLKLQFHIISKDLSKALEIKNLFLSY